MSEDELTTLMRNTGFDGDYCDRCRDENDKDFQDFLDND